MRESIAFSIRDFLCEGERACIDIHTKDVYGGLIMNGGQTTVRQRINITLPEETVRLIDRVTENGNRSRLIDEAVKRYVDEIGRANLKKHLKEGAIRRAERDLGLAEEWFSLEEGAWRGKRG